MEESTATISTPGRIIGISHRVKQTKDGKARPTLVVIASGDTTTKYELETENNELYFALGQFPIEWRKIVETDDLSKIPEGHANWKVLKDKDTPLEEIPANQRKKEKNVEYFATLIATKFVGFEAGDSVAMVLGGSGDMLAYALTDIAKKKGGKVLRLPPFILKPRREQFTALARSRGIDIKAPPKEEEFFDDEDVTEQKPKKKKKDFNYGSIFVRTEELSEDLTERLASKDGDHFLLAHLAAREPKIFYEIRPRDENVIMVRNNYRLRIDSMKARIGCEQRLGQRIIGKVFADPEMYAGASIEKAVMEEQATNIIYQNLCKEETAAETALQHAVENLDVYGSVFRTVEGISWAIATRMISAIQDIRRFDRPEKLVAYMGAHVISMAKCTNCGHHARRRDISGSDGMTCPKCSAHQNFEFYGLFPRRRNSEAANWHPDGRQGLYLFGDQMTRRPNMYWGARQRQYKALLRQAHPQAVQIKVVDRKGKEKLVWRWKDSHVHRTATWKTITDFTKWLYGAWWDFEKGDPIRPFPTLPPSIGSQDSKITFSSPTVEVTPVEHVSPEETVEAKPDPGSETSQSSDEAFKPDEAEDVALPLVPMSV